MKKTYLIIISLALALLFCGCAKFDVTCSINSQNFASMHINAKIPLKDLNANEINSIYYDVVDSLQPYWEKEGYDVSFTESNNNYIIDLEMSSKCESREDAFDELMRMMALDASPFSKVEGGYSSSFFNDVYTVSAQMDLTKIVDYATISEFPVSQREKVLEALDDVSGRVVFRFHGETVAYIGKIAGKSNIVEIILDEPAEISSTVKTSNSENLKKYDILENEISVLSESIKNYTIICASAGFAILIIIILAIVFYRKNKKRSTDIPAENSNNFDE